MSPRLLITNDNGLTVGFLVLLWLMSGCGKADTFERTHLSGKVTLDDVLITSGEIILTPDNDQGHSGPAVVIPIQNGIYQSARGNSPVAGATLVRINGFGDAAGPTSPDGVPIPIVNGYETRIDIPQGKAVFDFELKKEDLKKKK